MRAMSEPATITLQPGVEVRCPHCHRWHAVDQRIGSGVHTEYAQAMLYVVCGGSLFYVGNVGTPSRHPARPAA
jgi:hypothetical protein